MNKKLILRKKILNLFPRPLLEELSELEQPWHSDKANLIEVILSKWDQAVIQYELGRLLEKAK